MRIIRRMKCVSTRSANCLGSGVVISLSVLTSPWLVGAVSSQEWSQRLIQHFLLMIDFKNVQAHWPLGWTPDMVTEYLGQLAKLTEIIVEDNADIANVGMKNLLNNMVNDFHNIVKSF